LDDAEQLLAREAHVSERGVRALPDAPQLLDPLADGFVAAIERERSLRRLARERRVSLPRLLDAPRDRLGLPRHLFDLFLRDLIRDGENHRLAIASRDDHLRAFGLHGSDVAMRDEL